MEAREEVTALAVRVGEGLTERTERLMMERLVEGLVERLVEEPKLALPVLALVVQPRVPGRRDLRAPLTEAVSAVSAGPRASARGTFSPRCVKTPWQTT